MSQQFSQKYKGDLSHLLTNGSYCYPGDLPDGNYRIVLERLDVNGNRYGYIAGYCAYIENGVFKRKDFSMQDENLINVIMKIINSKDE
jgi:hypothetical protein